MRIKLNAKRGQAAVLDAPEARRGPARAAPPEVRRPVLDPVRPKRDFTDFAEDEDTAEFLRSTGRNRRSQRSLLPKTKWGRVAVGVGLLAVLAGVASGVVAAARFLEHDERFLIGSSNAIETQGLVHVQRAELLHVFGEDLDRNIFHVPLLQRQHELEDVPWVEHATVMRLLPNRLRVRVTERTPVAYVRQERRIGLVDAAGVLLEIPADVAGDPSYSFPVVTGISANEPLSTRAERMKIYERFLHELDAGGTSISHELSEVDLSDPEDVKALIPDHATEVLVHFGENDFLKRYQTMRANMDEWRRQYPRLASVDMRYERQVVLQMPPGETGGGTADPAGTVKPDAGAASGPAKAKDAAVAHAKAAPASTKAGAAMKKADAKKNDANKQWIAKRDKARLGAAIHSNQGKPATP